MRQNFIVTAEARDVQGKGASRRLRHTGKVPAIMYGGGQDPVQIQLDHNELIKHLKSEAFYTNILTVTLGGFEQQAVLKDMQRHPVREQILHVDLMRIRADKPIRMQIPLHFKGAEVAPGIKIGGGIMEHFLNQIEVECLPKDLPSYIEVDLSGMNVNESIHVSQLALGEGVSAVMLKFGNDATVVAVHVPRAEAEAAPADAKAAAKAPAKTAAKKK